MTNEDAIKQLKKYTLGKKNTEKVKISILQLNRVIKALEQEPCEDAISRPDAIRVASGYCHWSNIPKELAKLPSVNPIPCEDAISRQAVLEGLASIAKAKAKSDAQKSMMGRMMFFVEQLPSVSMENPNRCGDAISRDAAISIIQNWPSSDTGYSWGEKNVMKCAINELRDLPPVSTEKTGHWEKLSVGYGCSECSLCTNILGTIDFKYCPNCGAKMIEPQESEDAE